MGCKTNSGASPEDRSLVINGVRLHHISTDDLISVVWKTNPVTPTVILTAMEKQKKNGFSACRENRPQSPKQSARSIAIENNVIDGNGKFAHLDELIIEDKIVLDNGVIVRSFTCKQCGHKLSYKRNIVVHIEREHKMKGR